ncbi:MAG TPA: hypothetical protein VMT92_04055 [Steroidobacteraceae bacterium]|nr:hypothetical protein [Steroidobacteraceae bacterium]
MPRPSARLFLAAIGLAAACSIAAAPRTYTLPEHGVLHLEVPDDWRDKFTQGAHRRAPTVTLGPKSDANLDILIGVLWSTKDHPKVSDLDSLRSNVEATAKSAEQQSTEGTLSVRELPGSQGRGFYFAATDAGPNPGEHKYMTQGLVQVGTVALALTNAGQGDVGKTALAIIKSASHKDDGR